MSIPSVFPQSLSPGFPPGLNAPVLPALPPARKDQFIPTIADGAVSPTGHPNAQFPISLTQDGIILSNSLAGRQAVGQLATNGEYRLANGQTGNIFRDEVLRVSYQYGDHPFLTALRTTERQRAIIGSEIPLIRTRAQQLGLSGKGIKVAIIDPYEKIDEKDKEKKDPPQNASILDPLPPPAALLNQPAPAPTPKYRISSHSMAVQAIINDPTWGVAPGADVIQLPSSPSEPLEPKADDITELTSLLVKDVSSIFNRGAGQLQAAIQRNDPALRLVSMTWGTSRSLLYGMLLSLLDEKDEDKNFKYPRIRYNTLGHTLYGTTQDRFLAVVRYIDKRIIASPEVRQAFQRYLETTRAASSRGIIPTVSMANDRNLLKDVPPLPPGSAMNLLACSPFVIAAAASDTNQTPGYRADDRISPFSSPGDGEQFNPTIAAPGQEIGVGQPYGPAGRNLVINGTSFSTPYVCGVIALMLEANPSLTFEQVKAILQQSATPVAHSVPDEGAGVLNPEQAILQAVALRQNLQPPYIPRR